MKLIRFICFVLFVLGILLFLFGLGYGCYIGNEKIIEITKATIFSTSITGITIGGIIFLVGDLPEIIEKIKKNK